MRPAFILPLVRGFSARTAGQPRECAEGLKNAGGQRRRRRPTSLHLLPSIIQQRYKYTGKCTQDRAGGGRKSCRDGAGAGGTVGEKVGLDSLLGGGEEREV